MSDQKSFLSQQIWVGFIQGQIDNLPLKIVLLVIIMR